MNPDEARKRIAGGESETVEFKASFDKEVLETAGTLANTKGGTIFIGVADDGKVCGAPLGKS